MRAAAGRAGSAEATTSRVRAAAGAVAGAAGRDGKMDGTSGEGVGAGDGSAGRSCSTSAAAGCAACGAGAGSGASAAPSSREATWVGAEGTTSFSGVLLSAKYAPAPASATPATTIIEVADERGGAALAAAVDCETGIAATAFAGTSAFGVAAAGGSDVATASFVAGAAGGTESGDDGTRGGGGGSDAA